MDDTLTPEQFEGSETRDIVLRPGTPRESRFAGQAYLLQYGLPQSVGGGTAIEYSRYTGQEGAAAQQATEGSAKAALQPVPLDGGAELTPHRETEPRAVLRSVLARKRVQDQVASGDGAALAIDRVEVARAG